MTEVQDRALKNIAKSIRTGIRDIGISEHDMRKACEAAINNSRG